VRADLVLQQGRKLLLLLLLVLLQPLSLCPLQPLPEQLWALVCHRAQNVLCCLNVGLLLLCVDLYVVAGCRPAADSAACGAVAVQRGCLATRLLLVLQLLACLDIRLLIERLPVEQPGTNLKQGPCENEGKANTSLRQALSLTLTQSL